MTAASPPRRRGRPSAGEEGRSAQVTAKLTPSERRSCEDAARAEGKTLSEWARDALLLRAAALGLLLSACGARSGLDALVEDEPAPGAGGFSSLGSGGAISPASGGAVVASGGTGAGGRIAGAGGARPASGGRPGAGGAPSAGGTVAAGGTTSSGGAIAAGGMTASGGEPADAGHGDAGPDYCGDVRALCISAGVCAHVMIDCGHLQSLDCATVFQCPAGTTCELSRCVPK